MKQRDYKEDCYSAIIWFIVIVIISWLLGSCNNDNTVTLSKEEYQQLIGDTVKPEYPKYVTIDLIEYQIILGSDKHEYAINKGFEGCVKEITTYKEKTATESANITREIAIGFAEFITNKNWKEYIDIDTGKEAKIYWCQYKNIDEYYTTEELFDKYIESLK